MNKVVDGVNNSKNLPNDTSTVTNSPSKLVEGKVEDWRPVRSKKNKSRAKSFDNKSNPERLSFTKDDMTFLMDEDLSDDQQIYCAGRKKTFTDYSDNDDYEISDQDIGKIIIVMQTSRKAEQVYDRTGDWTTRVKVTQEIAKIINDGLYYYEQDLWSKNDHKQHKTLGLISQEDFDLYSGSPKKSDICCTPPPPPPPTFIDEEIKLDEVCQSGMCKMILFKIKFKINFF